MRGNNRRVPFVFDWRLFRRYAYVGDDGRLVTGNDLTMKAINHMGTSRIDFDAVAMACVKLLLLFIMAWVTLQCCPGGIRNLASAVPIANPAPSTSSGSPSSPGGRLVRTKYGSLRGFTMPGSPAQPQPTTTTTSSPAGIYSMCYDYLFLIGI